MHEISFPSVSDSIECEPKYDSHIRSLDKRIAEVGSASKGAAFEAWAIENIFDGKQRIRISPELNKHLIKYDEADMGLQKERVSDNLVDADGSLWDCKIYSEKSAIDRDQLRDYSLMERAGYVFDANGNRVEVKSVNYLFSNKGAAEANAWRLSGEATAWYVDENSNIQLLG